MYTVGLYTLGCKVSQYETEAVSERFSECGFKVLPYTDVCDAYVINTCTVTAESDRKSRQMIRRAVKRNPRAVIAVLGCYSQHSPQEVAKIDGVDIVIGTDKKLDVVGRVKKILDEGRGEQYVSAPSLEGSRFEEMSVKHAPRTRAYIKIEDGCDSHCSYCAIRLARGGVRSKLPEAVIAEAEALSSSGVREIVLTGIETGAYGKDFDFDYGLASLIAELDRRGTVERIRLGSLAPELVGGAFCEGVKDVKSLTPHFHISMQSGSDKILASMKRKYNSKMALENIERIRKIFPRAEFTTDMMVGFPGETAADFRASLDFIRAVGFLDVHVFAYSPREGTEAALYKGQIPEETKRKRSREMIIFKDRVRDERLDAIIACGEPLSVIAETALGDGLYSAHADNFAEMIFKASNARNLCGELVTVRPVSHEKGIIFGEEM